MVLNEAGFEGLVEAKSQRGGAERAKKSEKLIGGVTLRVVAFVNFVENVVVGD